MPQLKFGIFDKGFHTDGASGRLFISGQDEAGFRPYFLVTSGVIGCSIGVFREMLAVRDVPYDDIEVTADVTRILEDWNRIDSIDILVKVWTKSDAPLAQFEGALATGLRTSSMARSVNIKVSGRVEVVRV